MVNPMEYAQYAGFTETEVQNLCKTHHQDFSMMKQWYNGYTEGAETEELPAGDGYTDIELKWNQSAKGAIAQIKEKKYPDALAGYGGDILLVGISYEKGDSKNGHRHTCIIEEA